MSFGDDTLAPPSRDEIRARGFQIMARRMAVQIPSGYPRRTWDEEWYSRASGNAVCTFCQLEYSEHPQAPEGGWLHILCSGQRVKL